MSHAGTTEHPPAGNGELFTASEMAALQAEDRRAAKTIVWLMVSIFLLGLAGYSVVCMVVR